MSTPAKGTTRIPISDVPIGMTCQSDIYDDSGRLLLGRGNAVTAEFRDQLVQRGTNFLDIPTSNLPPSNLSGRSSGGSQGKRHRSQAGKRDSASSEDLQRADRTGTCYCPDLGEQVQSRIRQSVESVSRIASSIDSLSKEDLIELRELPKSLLEIILEDADLAISQCLSSEDGNRLASRCVRMAMMTINTAIELKMKREEVLRFGAAALMHDFGLFLCPGKLHDPRARLSADESWQYQQHPLTTEKILNRYPAIDRETILIATHVHERNRGDGYPRGLTQNVIHSLTRVIQVVDTYLALTDYFGLHPVLVPHDAMMFLLHETSRGALCRDTVRAFLNVNSLYPVGSHVRLSDGSEGIVIRRNDDMYELPQVECSQSQRLRDLEVEGVKIVGVVLDGKFQVRLPSEILRSSNLDEILAIETQPS